MKRKQKLLSRILLPSLLVLLLFPPLSCLIFNHAASRYAYTKAIDELETLQQNVLPLMKSSFIEEKKTDYLDDVNANTANKKTDAAVPSTTGEAFPRKESRISGSSTDTPANASDEKTAEYFENHGITAPASIRTFLSRVGPLVQRMGGDAHLMILSGEMRVIYPRQEQEKAMATALSEDFIKYIQTTELPENTETIELNASDGKTYLFNIYQIPTKSIQLKYLITYCSTSEIYAWVHSAGLLVLAISFVFVLIVMVVLWFTARSVTKPLDRLCRAASQIGSGSFDRIEPEFSSKELEDLRVAMNQMTERLLHSDEVQKTFFQNVSHELRNPLMSIGGYAQGIEQGVFQKPREAAHTIMEESARLTELVNSLLTLSRMENDQQKPTLGLMPIVDPMEDCLDRLKGLALKKGVSLILTPFDPSITAWCEEDLLCKVLDNLLTNALRYAKETVEVSVVATERRVQILVSDDGDGIAEKDLPHLFERCYKGKGGNFGIGLAIACSAAQKMEGTLMAANQKEGGAVFTLSLKRSA